MSLGTLIGFVSALVLFFGAIVLETDNYLMFINIPSIIMVLGGTLANAYISYQAMYVNNALKEAVKIFNHPKIDQNTLIKDINRSLEWADIAFKQGPPGLEEHLKNQPEEHLISFGIDCVLRQYEPKEIRELMTNTIESEFQRANVEIEVLDNMGSNCPAFGMIGTLVGLVIMLDNLGPDPAMIGGALAVALLTTLYGILTARLIFAPASKKLHQRASIERFRNYLMMEIFIMIAETRSANYVRDRIRSFLRPSVLQKIDNPREKVAGGDS